MNLIDQFKAIEEPMQIVVMQNDKRVQNLVACWGSFGMQIEVNKPEVKILNKKAWDELWKGININYEDIALQSGVHIMDVPKIFEIARINRLIYPDGTVHKQGKNYLVQLVASKIRSLQPKKVKDDGQTKDSNTKS